MFLAALGVLLLARQSAPRVWEGLLQCPFALALALLWRRRFHLARVAAAVQAGFIVLGWAASQYPYLVVPDITLQAAAASPAVQRALVVALAVGALLVFPSIALLLRIFQSPSRHG